MNEENKHKVINFITALAKIIIFASVLFFLISSIVAVFVLTLCGSLLYNVILRLRDRFQGNNRVKNNEVFEQTKTKEEMPIKQVEFSITEPEDSKSSVDTSEKTSLNNISDD